MAVRAPVGECCIIAKWSFLQCVNTYCRRPALATRSVEIETLVARRAFVRTTCPLVWEARKCLLVRPCQQACQAQVLGRFDKNVL
jgi:hypothetical protein